MRESARDDERDRLHNNVAALVWGIGGVLAIILGLYVDAWMEDWGIKAFLNDRGWLACLLSFILVLSVFLGWLSQRKRWVGMQRFIPFLPWVALVWILLLGHANWDALFGVIVSIAIMAAFIAYFAPYKYRKQTGDEDDLLGLQLLYGKISSLLQSIPIDQHGLAIAVCGPWGSGKSYFLGKVSHALTIPPINKPMGVKDSESRETPRGQVYNVATVDVWQCTTLEDMWNDIANALAAAIEGRINYRNCTRQVAGPIRKIPNLPIVSIADALIDIATSYSFKDSSSVRLIIDKIRNSEKGCLLILDNVERCTPDKAHALFALIEKLKNIPGLVTICGIATEGIQTSQSHQNEITSELLLKVFDVTIPMPLLRHEQVINYLSKKRGSVLQAQHAEEIADLPLRTPREIEKIEAAVAVVEKCYYEKIQSKIDKYGEKDVFPSLLYYISIRVLFPIVASYMESIVHARREIDKKKMQEELPPKKTFEQEILKCFPADYHDSRLLQYLLNAFDSGDYGWQTYFVSQEYLLVDLLSKEKKGHVVYRPFSDGESPLSVMEEESEINFSTDLGPTIYMEHLQMALDNPLDENGEMLQFINVALAQDILCEHPKISFSKKQLKELYMLLLNATYIIPHNDFHNTKQFLKYTRQVGDMQDLKTLSTIASSVLEQFREGMGDSEGKMFDWFHGIYDVFMVKRRGETSDVADSCRRVFALLLSSYVKRVCESMLTPNPSQRERMLWIIGRSNDPDDYQALLQEEVKTYVSSSEYHAAGLSHEQIIDALLHNMLAEFPDSDGRPVPLCAMSFAIIWDALRRKHLEGLVLAPKQKQYIHSVQEALREQKRYLENSEQAKEWSVNFWNDRMNAVEVLGNGLEEILKNKRGNRR